MHASGRSLVVLVNAQIAVDQSDPPSRNASNSAVAAGFDLKRFAPIATLSEGFWIF
jgi:hypothetical protein